MAKPKLALVPAAQGSKFYSVLPSSGVGDFTFSRSGSATRINSQGLIETVGNGVSRLNYPMIDGKVVGCPSHLLEPQRTNLITYSEDFSQSSWVKLGAGTGTAAIVTSDYAVSPDGTQNASRLQCDLNSGGSSSSNQSLIYNSYSSSGNQTISIYAKSNNGQNQTIYFANTQTSGDTITVTPQWERFTFSHSTSTYVSAIGLRGRSGGAINDTADILIWGSQVELGNYPTSYIPTNGEVNGVTRSAETANGSGDADTFNNSEGVFMAEISSLTNNNPLFNSLSIASGTTNVLSIGFSDGLNELYVFKTNGSSSWFKEVLVNDITNFNKIALSYESNDNQFWINGFKIETNNSIGIHPSAMSDMDFNAAVGNEFMYSNTKQIQYYDSALTDSELETLTSWVSFSDMANGQLYTIQ